VNSPNRDVLVRLARLLGPLTGELVFVGGRVADLLVTDPVGLRVRPTDDTDCVCEAATRVAYHRLGERLRARGFVAEEARRFLASGVTGDVIAGSLPDARDVPGLLDRVGRRFEAIARSEP